MNFKYRAISIMEDMVEIYFDQTADTMEGLHQIIQYYGNDITGADFDFCSLSITINSDAVNIVKFIYVITGGCKLSPER